MYEDAFRAGVWLQDDPGPFLGRAIVYKLQSKIHRDKHDYGPSVSFPVGQFTGGEMCFPQLKTKLQFVFLYLQAVLLLKSVPGIPLATFVYFFPA